MVRIAPVELPYNSRSLWFDAGEIELSRGDAVVVLTARGVEFGHLADAVFEATDDQIKKLKSPLKPVKRRATEEDIERAAELARLGAEALPVFREMAAETNEDMHPVAVEYLFDGDKAVFYFESEDRIDFRDLVHKLASKFHVRVDMRQVGVRDEARMIGGIGHCGQELCCKRLGGEFCPVSIRMAKEQDLSLNPQKISGVCGRLMCCLRYEYEAYKDFKSRAPKQNATIQTPVGPAKVASLDVPREIVTLRVEGEGDVKIPLADMDPATGDSPRPTSVGAEAWERATEPDDVDIMMGSLFSSPHFTGSDKLGSAKAVRRGDSSSKRASDSSSEAVADSAPKRRRRRRSTKVEGAETSAAVGSSEKAPAKSNAKGSPEKETAKFEDAKRKGMQPRRRRRGGAQGSDASNAEQASRQKQQKQSADKQSSGKKQSGDKKQGGKSRNAEKQQSSKSAASKKQRQNPQQTQGSPAGAAKSGGQRPGQKSSGLSQARRAQTSASKETSGGASGSGSQRRSRRRSHKADTGSAGKGETNES